MDKLFIFMSKIIKKYTSFMVGGKHNLDKIIADNKKIIIIYGHPLCQPCKKIMFKIPFIYVYYKFKGYVLKFCNVNENCKSCMEKFIHTTPTLIVYENGNEVKRLEDKDVLDNIYKIV